MPLLLPREERHPARRREEAALSGLRLTRGRVPALALATLAGLAGYLAHPPASLWPAVFLPAPLLLAAGLVEVRAAEREGRRARVFVLGMVAGVVTFGPMLTWLIRPAGTLGWGLLTLVQGVYYGLFGLLVRPFLRSWTVVVAAPLAWTGLEAWRGEFPLGGFDWGALSYAHADGSWLLPVARIGGSRALTLLTVLLGALAYDAMRRGWLATDGRGGSLADRIRAGATTAQPAVLGLVGVLLLGTLLRVEPPAPDGATLDVLAVQGNDTDDWGRSSARDVDLHITEKMLELTRQAVVASGPPDLTVWPESSVDRDPYRPGNEEFLGLVREAARLVGGDLLVGANLDGPRPRTFLNSAVLLDDEGREADRYVKRHLVPFGEYVPARSVLGELGPLRQIPRDGVPGGGPQTVRSGGVGIAVAICFETLFGDLVRGNVREGGAGLIVATTNDASFGRSAEPRQHLAQSRMRAVETGRWVVHAALSGATAFVSPDGGIGTTTELFTLATLRQQVPVVTGSTPFLAVGDVVGPASRLATLALIGYLVLLRRRRGAVDGQGARP